MPYISAVTLHKIAIMTISRHCLAFSAGAHACIFAVLLALSAPSHGLESAAVEPDTARNKLQNFTDRASELVLRAMGLIGIRYQYGGGTPEQGMDCSGLVRYVFKEAWNIDLPRTSKEISQLGERIEMQDLQPGDLVFYDTLRRSFSHVGIYLGDKKFIHSPSAGGDVRVESMDGGYWKKRFNGARRIVDQEQK
jgi:cell wall-associated NlpC family hydrolase